MATSSPDVTARIAGLHKEVLARIENPEPLAENIQGLIGELSRTLPYLPRLKNAGINVDQAELAIRALLSVEPEVTLAKAICEDLARRVDIYKSPIRSVINGRTPATFLLLGVLVHSAVLGLAVFFLSRVILCQEGVASPCWITMTFAGAVGGATSLFTRLNEIAALSRWGAEGDPLQLFYTGLLKPFVGIVTGLFAYAAISTGIVTIHAPGSGSPATLYVAIAFLAGFSERFAQDLTNATPIGSD